MNLLDKLNISRAVKSLLKGELVVVPTETVFGIIGNAFDENAYNSLNKIKNREENKKYTLFVKNRESIEQYAFVNEITEKIVRKMMPGPLTIVLKAKNLPRYLISEDGTIGLRIPAGEKIENILNRVNFPLISTSANISGENSIDGINGIKDVFGNKISVYLNGKIKGKIPSTVVRVDNKIEILRRGPYKIGDFVDFGANIIVKKRLKILFVCQANIVRSPIAEYYVKKTGAFDVRSSGIRAAKGMFPTKEAIEVAKTVGVDITHHPSRPLTKEDILWADMIFATDNMVRADIYDTMGFKSKVFLLSDFSRKMKGELIPDPYKFGIDAYYKMIKLLKYHLDELIKALSSKIETV